MGPQKRPYIRGLAKFAFRAELACKNKKVRHAVGLKNDAEFAGKTTKTRHPEGIKIPKMTKNDKKNTKRNHRAQEMTDFTENGIFFGKKAPETQAKRRYTKPPRTRNG